MIFGPFKSWIYVYLNAKYVIGLIRSLITDRIRFVYVCMYTVYSIQVLLYYHVIAAAAENVSL